MKTIAIICEGLTESNFIKRYLAPYLEFNNIIVKASILKSRSGRHVGGRVTVDRVAERMRVMYHDVDRVSSFVDFYGFQDTNGRTKDQLETAIFDEIIKMDPRIDGRFVKPYIQMYEFEGLLFSNPEAFRSIAEIHLLNKVPNKNHKKESEIEKIIKSISDISEEFSTPEDINNSIETAPSKRITRIFENTYNKTEHGPYLAGQIGIDVIREKCPLFNKWVIDLQNW